MDQAPERNIKDANFLFVFSIAVGATLICLALYLFATIAQMLAAL